MGAYKQICALVPPPAFQLTFSFFLFLFARLLVAGRDTTANCLSWAFYELYKNPHTLEKLRQEIETILQGQPATYDDVAERLPYLHAVVQETLRLHPSVPKVREMGCHHHGGSSGRRCLGSSRYFRYLLISVINKPSTRLCPPPPFPQDAKVAVADDVLPDGTKIPANAKVIYLPYVMGRMERWAPLLSNLFDSLIKRPFSLCQINTFFCRPGSLYLNRTIYLVLYPSQPVAKRAQV